MGNSQHQQLTTYTRLVTTETPTTRNQEQLPATAHYNENTIYVFSEKELRGLSPNLTSMCMWAIFIFQESVHIFSCSRMSRRIVGIYKTLRADTWMWKLELRPSNSFFWEYLFPIFGIVSSQCTWQSAASFQHQIWATSQQQTTYCQQFQMQQKTTLNAEHCVNLEVDNVNLMYISSTKQHYGLKL